MNAKRLAQRLRTLPLLALALAALACQGQVPDLVQPQATSTFTPFPTTVPFTETVTPTASSTLRPSSTPLPTFTLAPSLTAVPSLTPSPGVVGIGLDTGPFRDDFSDPLSGWITEQGEDWGMGYFQGGYRIYNNFIFSDVCAGKTSFHTDVVIGVQVTRLDGPDNGYFGVSCRKTGDNYYNLGINAQGQYSIHRVIGGEITLLTSGESGAIRQGDLTNHVVGSCIGHVLTLTVNGVEVVSYTDATGPLFGSMVGIVVGTTSEPGLDILFDNFDSAPVAGAPPFPTGTLTTTPGTPTSTATATP